MRDSSRRTARGIVFRDRRDAGQQLAARLERAQDTAHRLGELADDLICLATPEHFSAVGEWYDDFAQTGDDVVLRILSKYGGEA